jgi:lipopolysaccharide transport system permease protein
MEQRMSASSSSETPPITVIEPPRGWIGLDLRELWQYRELFGFMVWRDIKVMYKQTLLGAAWAVLVPFTQMVIFTFIFGRVAGLDSDGLPGPLFYYAGLLPWTYFATSLTMSSGSMVTNARMLTKIYFPRLILPASACITPLVNFAIASVILFVIMAFYRVAPPPATLALPLLLVLAFMTAMGAGLVLAAMNVKYRDVKYTIPFLVQIWMYVTVILPFSSFKSFGEWRWLYGLNPLGSVVEGFRWCLFHLDPRYGERVVIGGVEQFVPIEFPWLLMAISTPVAAGILAFGLYYFRRMERMFADII